MFKPARVGETMENIEKSFKYGAFIDDMTLNNSTIQFGKDQTLRLYKSRSGAAAKDKPRRLWISKTRYYIDKELTADQLKKVRSFISAMRRYRSDKAKGKTGLIRPTEPRFANVKPHKVEKKAKFKGRNDWDNIAVRYENIVINTFNCTGQKVFGEYFITLTQRDHRLKGQKVADAQYNAFLKKLKRWIGSKTMKNGKPFKYSLLTVKEYGAQGFHYHILLKVKLQLTIKQVYDKINTLWNYGKVYVEKLTDALKLSKYFFGSGSTERVRLQGDETLIKQQIEQKEREQKDFIRLAKAAEDKGAKDLAQSYIDGAAAVKDDLKQLRRSLTKRDDTIMRSSGDIKKNLRVTSQDKYLWQFIRENASYMYSELIQVKDISETGEVFIMNEIYNDYYSLTKDKAAFLYNYINKLIDQGKAKRK